MPTVNKENAQKCVKLSAKKYIMNFVTSDTRIRTNRLLPKISYNKMNGQDKNLLIIFLRISDVFSAA